MKKLILLLLLSLVSISIFPYNNLERDYVLICNKDTTSYFLMDKKSHKIVESVDYDSYNYLFKKNKNTLIRFRDFLNDINKMNIYEEYINKELRFDGLSFEIVYDNVCLYKKWSSSKYYNIMHVIIKPYDFEDNLNRLYYEGYHNSTKKLENEHRKYKLVKYYFEHLVKKPLKIRDYIYVNNSNYFNNELNIQLKNLNKDFKKILSKNKIFSENTYCQYCDIYIFFVLLESPIYNEIADKAVKIINNYKELYNLGEKNIKENKEKIYKKYNL